MTETQELDMDLIPAMTAKLTPRIDLDRSLLEAYSDCPMLGWCKEAGKVADTSACADSGTEVHTVFGYMTDLYAQSGGNVGAEDMESVKAELLKARPDVQPDAIAGAWGALWGVWNFLRHLPGGGLRNPDDVLLYQGGLGERSGQLAMELLPEIHGRGAVYGTSEIDLLLAGACAGERYEIDFKSGHTQFSATKVQDSFQFQMHAALMFANYPDVEELHTAVWMTRFNRRTPWVTFRRNYAEQYAARVLSACRLWMGTHGSVAAGGTPSLHRLTCVGCPAAIVCVDAAPPAHQLAKDPVAFLLDTERLQEAADQRHVQLVEYVRRTGADIAAPGIGFGLEAPTGKARKPSAAQYKVYRTGTAVESESECDLPAGS